MPSYNFELDPSSSEKVRNSVAAADKAMGEASKPTFLPNYEAFAKMGAEMKKANNAPIDQQAKMAGVNRSDMQTNAGGIEGFFGATKDVNQYTAQNVKDPWAAHNKTKLAGLADEAAGRQAQTMVGAQVGPAAQIAMGPQDQMRARQSALLDQLVAASNGQGPSVAQQQLKTGADRTLASNLAMAAAQGTPAAARQAAFMNAQATQDMAGQAAVLRAQEMNDARGLLGSVAQGARGQDIGLATDQAGLNQQALLTQAGLNQDTAKTNLLTGIEQQKQKDDLIKQYVLAGMSLDEAARNAEIQQRQFNAGLLAQQEAARNGIAIQNNAQALQAGGAVVGGVGSFLGSLLDSK